MAEGKHHYGKMSQAMFEGYVLLQTAENTEGSAYHSRIIEVNEAFETMFDTPRDKALDQAIEQILPQAAEKLFEIPKGLMEAERAEQFEFSLKETDRHFLARAFNPSADKTVLLFNETTLQKRAKDAFRLHELLFENAHDIILYITLEGRIVNANKRACEQYGYTKKQLLSMTIHDIRHPSAVPEYEHQMQMADDEGIIFECVHVRNGGQPFPVEVSAKSTYTKNGRFRVHIIRDITKRKESEEKIIWLARHDPLTRIPNRANFITRLEEEIKSSLRNKAPFAVMMFDVDKFKYINDHHGHEAGDLVLCHVAQAAEKTLRAGDMIGRFGGDEFAVLQTGINGCADVEALANRIQAAVNETIMYESIPMSVKISIGISLFPKDATDANILLHCADKAMYKIKQAGGGAFNFFTPCNPPCLENRLCFDRHEPMEKSQ